MKKYIATLLLVFALGIALPQMTYAAGDFLKPDSSLYFLQSWGESVRLFFTFSKEGKFDYLSHLNDKRISELQGIDKKDSQLANKLIGEYEDNYQKIETLAGEIGNKTSVAEKIESNNLIQQAALAEVYAKVPEEAKAGILNAQINSSKNVSAVLQKVSPEKVQDYAQKVQEIQQAQMVAKAAKVEKESGNEGGSPEGRGPKSLNSIKGGNDINSANAGSQNSQGKIQQAPMQSSASKN